MPSIYPDPISPDPLVHFRARRLEAIQDTKRRIIAERGAWYKHTPELIRKDTGVIEVLHVGLFKSILQFRLAFSDPPIRFWAPHSGGVKPE